MDNVQDESGNSKPEEQGHEPVVRKRRMSRSMGTVARMWAAVRPKQSMKHSMQARHESM